MHGENLRKFTETRAEAPRASYALISSRPKVQYYSLLLVDLLQCSIRERAPFAPRGLCYGKFWNLGLRRRY
jgi:hypothetical protein